MWWVLAFVRWCSMLVHLLLSMDWTTHRIDWIHVEDVPVRTICASHLAWLWHRRDLWGVSQEGDYVSGISLFGPLYSGLCLSGFVFSYYFSHSISDHFRARWCWRHCFRSCSKAVFAQKYFQIAREQGVGEVEENYIYSTWLYTLVAPVASEASRTSSLGRL